MAERASPSTSPAAVEQTRSAPPQQFPPPGPFEIARNEAQQLSASGEKIERGEQIKELHTSIRAQDVIFTNRQGKVRALLVDLQNLGGVTHVLWSTRPPPLQLPQRCAYSDDEAYEEDVVNIMDDKLAAYTVANKSLETQEHVLELEIEAETQKKDRVVVTGLELYLRQGIGLRQNIGRLNLLIMRNAPISVDQLNLRMRSAKVRYERYKVARTMQEYLALGGTKEDLETDLIRGFVRVLDEAVVFRREIREGGIEKDGKKTPQRRRAEALIRRAAPISVDQSKRRKKEAGIRYEKCKPATTARQYFDLGGTINDLMVDLNKGRVVVLDEAEAGMPPAAPFSMPVAPTPVAPTPASSPRPPRDRDLVDSEVNVDPDDDDEAVFQFAEEEETALECVPVASSAPAAELAPTGLSAEEEEEGIALECVPRKRAKGKP